MCQAQILFFDRQDDIFYEQKKISYGEYTRKKSVLEIMNQIHESENHEDKNWFFLCMDKKIN